MSRVLMVSRTLLNVMTVLMIVGALCAALLVISIANNRPDLSGLVAADQYCFYVHGSRLAYSPQDLLYVRAEPEQAALQAPWLVAALERGDVCCGSVERGNLVCESLYSSLILGGKKQ